MLREIDRPPVKVHTLVDRPQQAWEVNKTPKNTTTRAHVLARMIHSSNRGPPHQPQVAELRQIASKHRVPLLERHPDHTPLARLQPHQMPMLQPHNKHPEAFTSNSRVQRFTQAILAQIWELSVKRSMRSTPRASSDAMRAETRSPTRDRFRRASQTTRVWLKPDSTLTSSSTETFQRPMETTLPARAQLQPWSLLITRARRMAAEVGGIDTSTLPA